MALNIKDPVTDAIARELSHLTGESITIATREALRERLERVRERQRHRHPDLTGIIARGRARATIDHRPDDEILGYGGDGLPS